MIKLAYLGEDKKIQYEEEDYKKLLIVRSPPKVIPTGFIHTPQLSPSLDLFFRAKAWKKGQFSLQDYDDISFVDDNQDSVWFHLYAQRFNRELRERPDMVKALQKLIHLSNKGETIYLFCYCKNPHKCHRGLIGLYLQEQGVEVDFREEQEEQQEQEDTQLSLF